MTEKLLIGILNFNPGKQTIVGILTFLSMKTSLIITISVSSFNFSLNRVEHLKCFITLGPGFVICCFSCFELQPQLTELLQTAEGLKEVGTVSALKPYITYLGVPTESDSNQSLLEVKYSCDSHTNVVRKVRD